MARFKLSRRTVLRGAANTAVALPFLEAMTEGPARAAVAPRRYVVVYGGFSLTLDFEGGATRLLLPKQTGEHYDLPRDLTPLGPLNRTNDQRTIEGFDVQDEVTVVSGLKIPWAFAGQAVPPGGRVADFHGCTMAPHFCGTRALDRDSFTGPSSDQIVATEPKMIDGARFPTLPFMVQADLYSPGYGPGRSGNLSFGAGGKPLSPNVSPRATYQLLFDDLPAAGTGTMLTSGRQLLLEQDRSILDHLVARANRLAARLGAADRARLDQHFSEIRALEKRIKNIPEIKGPACQRPADPGKDAEVTLDKPPPPSDASFGWADEIRRGEAMRQMLYLSLACDLTRIASLQLTYRQSYMNIDKLCGIRYSVHGAGHSGGGTATGPGLADMVAWHVEQVAWLVKMLRDTLDVDGRPMIDNTVIVFGTEGGSGLNPEVGQEIDPKNPVANHSTENMSVLVAGGRALGLHPGRHLVKKGVHPAAVLRTAMRAVGVDRPLGDIDDVVADL